MCKWMETAEKQNIYIMCPKKKKNQFLGVCFFFFFKLRDLIFVTFVSKFVFGF